MASFLVNKIFSLKKVIKINRLTLKLFVSYYFGPNIDFVTNLGSEKPGIGLTKIPKQSLPAFTPSISGKTRGNQEKWL
jgi:hypothetical protein